MYQNFNREQQLTVAGGRQLQSVRNKIDQMRMDEMEKLLNLNFTLEDSDSGIQIQGYLVRNLI
jgi:hypothetical protein